jgi:hypothetical protein
MKKTILLFIPLFLFQTSVYSSNDSSFINNQIIEKSIGFGSVLAIVISWSKNKNILYAILHGILGWLYVIYYAITDLKRN